MAYLAVLSIVWTVVLYAAATTSAIFAICVAIDYDLYRRSKLGWWEYIVVSFILLNLGVLANVYAATHTMYLP